ncbi:helix-turn-helix transcriptional regulator [Haladaptatus sp. ZSTT2]|uniref:helix-turn-helix transcriptional regulator n=1 Tax=Haladaptatus sp. ZSTT2 TaxID=3120515 RepID=UPI00300EBCA2
MGTAFDDLAFLAGSENRPAVLLAVTERPHTRDELEAETGASRVTLGRILADLTDRGWIRRRGRQYEVTGLGRLVANAYKTFFETMETVAQLQPLAPWLPVEDFGFDIDRLEDASVTIPTHSDPLAPYRHAAHTQRQASSLTVLTNATAPQNIEVIWRRTTAGDLTIDAILTHDVIDTIQNDEQMASMFRDILASGQADIRRYNGDIPFIVAVADDLVDIAIADEGGLPRGLIQVVDEEVRSWAEQTIARYREQSMELSVESFAG